MLKCVDEEKNQKYIVTIRVEFELASFEFMNYISVSISYWFPK
jgi:hypothetical protein